MRKTWISNKEELWKAMEMEMEATSSDYCKKLIESMPNRLRAVIAAKGGPTEC